jgi:hypothetical protein
MNNGRNLRTKRRQAGLLLGVRVQADGQTASQAQGVAHQFNPAATFGTGVKGDKHG